MRLPSFKKDRIAASSEDMIKTVDAVKRRELILVILFTVIIRLPFLANAYHLDEPHYLAVARHILIDPLHPLAFHYNWFGRDVPMRLITPYPVFVPYMLSLGLRLTGGVEWAMRALFLPLDAAAAAALYLLAARFLSMPLWPTLIVLAGPAYFINTHQLMPEKWMTAFGFCGLYALVRGVDESRRGLFWASAALMAAGFLSKYSAVFLLPTAAAYCLRKGVRPSCVAAYCCMAAAPSVCYVLLDVLRDPGAVRSYFLLTSRGLGTLAAYPNKLRAVLAFIGGCGIVTALWPAWELRDDRHGGARWTIVSAVFAAFLFLPAWDEGAILSVDRWMGASLSWGTLLASRRLWLCWRGRLPGAELWLPWALSVAAFQMFLYWSVVSRYILFLLPPLVFALSAALEFREPARRLRRLYAASLALVLLTTLGLAVVDRAYAAAQRNMASAIREKYAAPGRTIWFTGHWGLQYYMEAAGAVPLELDRGWDAPKTGDVVVLPSVNTNVILPRHPLHTRVQTFRIDYPLPLRLISGISSNRQAGFYSSIYGFLPFALSREPIEEFSIVEIL